MAEPLAMTTTVRDFIRQVYAETAATVQQVFAEDQLNTTLQLAQVRICCGSEPINRVEGGYLLSEGTPWLAELCFGAADAQAVGTMVGTLPEGGSKAIASLSCQALQGVGPGWNTRLAGEGIATIGAFAQLEPVRVATMMRQWRSRQVLFFFAKARTALAPLPLVPRNALAAQPATELLLRTPEQLSRESGVLHVHTAAQLLHYLFSLFTVLDDSVLNRLSLGEILAL